MTAAPGTQRHSRLGLLAVAVVALAFALTCLLHGNLPRLSLPAHPKGWLLAVPAAAIGASYLFAALTLRTAANRRLPWGRTVLVQLAAALANRIVPAGLGGMGVNLRYLQKTGLSAPAAGVAVAAVALANGAATLLVAAVVVPLAATSIHLGHLVPIAVAGGIAVAVVAATLLLGRQQLPVAVRTRVLEARRGVVDLCHDPARLALLLAGALGNKLAHLAALLAALAAFGSTLPALVVIAVYLAGSAVASSAPIPGGLGAVEAALVSGLLAAGGPLAIVLGGVIVFRLASFWLPILPGLAATWALRRKNAV